MNTLLDSLEEFWDAEVPRLGEQGARGWDAWTPSSSSTTAPTAATPPRTIDAADAYERWAATEGWHDRHAQLPSRGIAIDAPDSDPYAAVLFADVRMLLLPLASPGSKDAFRRLWLTFLGLPLPGFVAALPNSEAGADVDASGASVDERWGSTHFARVPVLAAVFPDPAATAQRITADAYAGVLVGREREYVGSALALPVREWSQGAVGPLEALGPPEAPTNVGWCPVDVAAVDAGFVRNVFAQCRLGRGDEAWDVLAVAFESAVNIKRSAGIRNTKCTR
jgi:hypothetical protein